MRAPGSAEGVRARTLSVSSDGTQATASAITSETSATDRPASRAIRAAVYGLLGGAEEDVVELHLRDERVVRSPEHDDRAARGGRRAHVLRQQGPGRKRRITRCLDVPRTLRLRDRNAVGVRPADLRDRAADADGRQILRVPERERVARAAA